jgi:hypothetical protein
MVRKILGTISILACTSVFGAEVIGEGEYRFGPETSQNIACSIAEQKAKENVIANFLGEYIEHSTEEVCRDQECTTHKQFFSETSGQIKRIIQKESNVVPEKGYSVCIVDMVAEVEKVKNTITFRVNAKNQFRHGEKFSVSVISNRTGYFAVFNVINDRYQLVYDGRILRKNAEVKLPKDGNFEALVPARLHQSSELLTFIFTENRLTLKQEYSKMEFEELVKQVSFTQRKLVNHHINIVR